MIFNLAKETGWPEKTLLWETPFARLLHYYHAALRSHDLWTVKPGPSAAIQLDTLGKAFQAFQEFARLDTPDDEE